MPACAAVRRMRHGGRCCCRARAQSSTCEGHARKNSARTHTIPRAISQTCPALPANTPRYIFSRAGEHRAAHRRRCWVYIRSGIFIRAHRAAHPPLLRRHLPPLRPARAGPISALAGRPWPAAVAAGGGGGASGKQAGTAVVVAAALLVRAGRPGQVWTKPTLARLPERPRPSHRLGSASPVPVPSLAGPASAGGPWPCSRSRRRMRRRCEWGAGAAALPVRDQAVQPAGIMERVQRDMVGQVRVPIRTQVRVLPKSSP